mgnify:CR=1 FL=1
MTLAAPAIAAPTRSLFRHQANLTTLLAEVLDIQAQEKKVLLSDGATLVYDHLIVAAGATHSYFGHDEWSTYAPGLKTLEDALEIRRRVLLAFELAEREAYLTGVRKHLNFVVVGGGATGVLRPASSTVTRTTSAARPIAPRRKARRALMAG